jgi:hypothetical protein
MLEKNVEQGCFTPKFATIPARAVARLNRIFSHEGGAKI